MRINEKSSMIKTAGAILLPLLCLSSLAFAQWPRFHGNSHNTGVYTGAQGRNGTFSELWNYPMENTSNSSAALADLDDDGLLEVIIGSDADTLYAFNGEDGSILWRFTPGSGSPVCSSPVITDLDGDQKPEVIFATKDYLRVLQGESGVLIWSKPIDGATALSPCAADLDGDGSPEVIFSGTTRTTAFDGETGAILWTAEDYIAVSYGSAVAEDTDLDGSAEVMVFTLDPDTAFCLLDGTDGSLLWSTPVPVKSSIITPAAAFGDLDMDGYPEIVSCSGDNDLYIMNANDGSIVWSVEFPGALIYSSPCLLDLDGNDSLEIVVAQFNTRMFRAYTCTGDVIWTSVTDRFPMTTAAIEDIDGDQTLEILQTSSTASNSTVQSFNSETGVEEWRLSFNGSIGSSPAIGDLDGDGYYDFVFYLNTRKICAMSSVPHGIDPQSGNDPLNLVINPNPFKTCSSISFELARPGFTSVEVFDLSGRIIATIENSQLPAGEQSVQWDGRSQNGEPVSAGLYFCRIQSGGISETRGFCLLR